MAATTTTTQPPSPPSISKPKSNTLRSSLKTLPIYSLATLCLASSILRILTIYNTQATTPSASSSQVNLPGWLYSFILFPASSPSTESVLTAAGIDLVCGMLVLAPRTRFFASGTVLVLQGVSAGGTLQGVSPPPSTSASTSSPSVGTAAGGAGGAGYRAFEIAAFKLMLANVATLSAWRDSRITSRVVESLQGKSKSTSNDAVRPAGPKVDVVPNSVHHRLR